MKNKLSRLAPPGINLKTERDVFVTGMVCAFLFSLGYVFRYINAYSSLFSWRRDERVFLEGAVMPDFCVLLDRSLLGFIVAAACMLALIIYHYAYHHQGTKSIYLMRRLPNRWERHRRCITLPLLAALVCLLAALVLLLIYYIIYMAFTPQQCLRPGQWEKIWSVLI